MNVKVIYNPISGQGRARQMADSIAMALTQANCEVELIPTEASCPETWLAPKVTVAPDAVVVVGGDGTLRQVASVLVSRSVPVYHAPSGTENLFAKSMGTSIEPKAIVASILQQTITIIDTATANGSFMLLMASVGFDAEVVTDLSSRRGSSISRWSYVMPFIRQALRWAPPELTIQVDDECVVHKQHGWAIVANSEAYACGSNPAREADITDGVLDLLFIPFKGRSRALRWLLRLARGTHIHHPDAVYVKGTEVTVLSTPESLWQLDGDPAGKTSKMVIRCNPASLVVLRPV